MIHFYLLLTLADYDLGFYSGTENLLNSIIDTLVQILRIESVVYSTGKYPQPRLAPHRKYPQQQKPLLRYELSSNVIGNKSLKSRMDLDSQNVNEDDEDDDDDQEEEEDDDEQEVFHFSMT
jgi:hypothetical protein